MNANEQKAWRGVALSVALAGLCSMLVYVALTGLSTAAANDFPRRGNGNPPPTLLDVTEAYTSYLPIVLRMCPYQSTRPPLQGTASFAGEAEILTPPHCTTGLPAEEYVPATGTYTGKPTNVTLWVLACTPDLLYYPQSPDACEGKPPDQTGRYWQVPLYLGEKGGEPEWFDVVVILTDQEASQFLSDWVREGCQDGEYRGISADLLNLMAITEEAFISVQTVD
jgi:hypothetical protein